MGRYLHLRRRVVSRRPGGPAGTWRGCRGGQPQRIALQPGTSARAPLHAAHTRGGGRVRHRLRQSGRWPGRAGLRRRLARLWRPTAHFWPAGHSSLRTWWSWTSPSGTGGRGRRTTRCPGSSPPNSGPSPGGGRSPHCGRTCGRHSPTRPRSTPHWSWAHATISGRTVSPRRSSACPAVSTRRWSPRSRSMPWDPPTCTGSPCRRAIRATARVTMPASWPRCSGSTCASSRSRMHTWHSPPCWRPCWATSRRA